jgi:hypothetical protein
MPGRSLRDEHHAPTFNLVQIHITGSMHRRILALSALTFAGLTGADAFAPPSAQLRGFALKSGAFAACRATPQLRAASRTRPQLAMASGDVPEGQKAFEAAERSMDEWFALLADSRQSIRQMASVKIAELHDAEGKGDETIQRLFTYLTLEDVLERRAAVQCLGMIGQKTLPPLIGMHQILPSTLHPPPFTLHTTLLCSIGRPACMSCFCIRACMSCFCIRACMSCFCIRACMSCFCIRSMVVSGRG